MSRLHPANLRAAFWAVLAARRTRRLLTAEGLDRALAPPPPPALPAAAERGVRAALRRRRETCLVNAIVLQAWEAAHGRRRDLVIGTTGPNGFQAHAWLEGDPLPGIADAALDPSVLGASEAVAPQGPDGRGDTGGGDADESAEAFRELLRRPAPGYSPAQIAQAE